MKIFNDIQNLPEINKLVLTIGTFDGVHLGHQELLTSIIRKAKEINGSSGLMTFHPHPRMILQPAKRHSIKLLTTIEERIDKLNKIGLDYLFIVPFSVDFANMAAEQYIREILVETLHPHHLVIGYDHQFGKGREGNYDLLEELSPKYDYSIEQITQKKIDNLTFSSTNIRNFLLDGEIERANKLLGYLYEITGIVAHGDKRGRSIGFPTANIKLLDENKLIPGKGVYAVQTEIDGEIFDGMLNIGNRPTFDGTTKTIENHLFDFDENIYGRKVCVRFIKKIREEKKFGSSEELTSQLNSDTLAAKNALSNY